MENIDNTRNVSNIENADIADNTDNTTNKEKFLSDLDITQRLQSNVVNLIYAPVGSGKTTWVNTKLIDTVEDKREILYLIDTTAGRDQIINDNAHMTSYSQSYENWLNESGRLESGRLDCSSWGDFISTQNKVPTLTFSKLAHAIKRNGRLGYGKLKHIVLDECQNLKIYQGYGEVDDENVLLLLEQWLKYLYKQTDIKITALSATPRQISLMFPANNLNDILTSEEKGNLRTLKNGFVREYVSINNLLSNLPKGKIVIYTSRIDDMKRFAEIVKSRDNRNIEMIWSRNNQKHELTQRQRDIWDSILNKAEIPNDIDILAFNAACLTGINIKSHIDYVIVHDTDEDNQTQARGRIRQDIKGLFIPNKQGDYIAIPDEFINKPLYKEDKELLARSVNIVTDGHLRKFTTISRIIRRSPDYYFELTRNGSEAHRYRQGGKDLSYHIIKRTAGSLLS